MGRLLILTDITEMIKHILSVLVVSRVGDSSFYFSSLWVFLLLCSGRGLVLTNLYFHDTNRDLTRQSQPDDDWSAGCLATAS